MNDPMQAIERREPHPHETLQAGDTLGRYQLLCPIARGGMGQVWAARQTGRLGLPKLVAIKTAIPFESKDYRQVQEYLFDEAQVAASIDHPNVCKILELGQDSDALFIAMEWLNGATLLTLVGKLPQRRLAYRIAASLLAQACSGLHAAHELTDDDGVNLEVVHRDATPHNFMITHTGELKVMDFGIVKSKNQQHQATQTGELKGKISYLSPEQICGRRIDRRTDIFTLGCDLYLITVGKGAFNPDTNQDAGLTIHRIVSGQYLPPSSVLPDYPPELEAIVVRALQTAPEKRFQSAEEMRVALEEFLGDGSRSVSREDVAALLNEYCGPIIEQRRSQIRLAQKQFDWQSGQKHSGAYPVAERTDEIGSLDALGSQSNAEKILERSRCLPLVPAVRRSKLNRKLVWPILTGTALLIMMGLGVYALRQPAPAEDSRHAAKPADLEPPRTRQPVTITQQREAATHGSVPIAQPMPERESVSQASPTRAESASRSSRKTNTPRVAVKTALTAETSAAAAPASANGQFSQTLSRKPPRHAIDESDPFEK